MKSTEDLLAKQLLNRSSLDKSKLTANSRETFEIDEMVPMTDSSNTNSSISLKDNTITPKTNIKNQSWSYEDLMKMAEADLVKAKYYDYKTDENGK